jgi:phage baseplate assembly protein W
LDDDQEGKDFERRIRLAEVMLKEKDIDSNKEIAVIQNSAKQAEKANNDDYLNKASEMMQ